MFISRTTRGVSQIPGASMFCSFIKQDPPPEDQKISMAPCSSCKKVFEFPQCTPWHEIEKIIENHCLGCDKKRAAASANAKKRWAKEKQRSSAAHDPESPQMEDINIRQKRGARVEEKTKTSTRTCQTLPERKILLEEDPWTVTETLDLKRVECVVCSHSIRGLDKRRLYYPGCTAIDRDLVRAGIMLRHMIRRRFMSWQVNPPHKAFHDPAAYFLHLGLQMRRKRRWYTVLKGYAISRLLLRRAKVATAALAVQHKAKDDDKMLEVVSRGTEECTTCNNSSEAEVVPPIKTSSSTWWSTVLGPGTGESQPIAGSHVRSPTAHQERLSAEHSSTCLKESPVETAVHERAIEYHHWHPKTNYESGDRVQSSRDQNFRIQGFVYEQEVERCNNQPSFRVPCSFAGDGGHWMVRGDARGRHEYNGTCASDMRLGSPVANISALGRRASPIQVPSVLAQPCGAEPIQFQLCQPKCSS